MTTLRARLAATLLVQGMVVLAMAACGALPRDAHPLTIRVANGGQLDFDDLAASYAHARLEEEGYRIVETSYASSELAVDALARGHADVSMGAIPSAWAAAGRGAPVRTVMEHVKNEFRLVAAAGVSRCADLDGRSLALHGASGASTVLTRAFLAEECPTARPRALVLPDSASRAAAMLAGRADAAVLDLDSVGWLDHAAGDRFQVLENFAERWPAVRTSGVHVNTGFAAERPDLVLAYMRARLDANRELTGRPDRVLEEATRVLGASVQWPRISQMYAAAGVWATDGGLTETDVMSTLELFGMAALSADAVADLSFLRTLSPGR